MFENINTGVCPRRLQENKPCFFVNYTENGINKYEFFSFCFQLNTFKNLLLNQNEHAKNRLKKNNSRKTAR